MPYDAVQRWYTTETFTNRNDAVEYARKRKREEDSRGYHNTYRVRKSQYTSKWIVEYGRRATDSEMAHARRFNRMERESETGQRRLKGF